MKTTIVYRTNAAGELVEKIEIKGGLKIAMPSYDSQIDMPMHQRVWETYKNLEARGELHDNQCEGGITQTRNAWKREAEKYA